MNWGSVGDTLIPGDYDGDNKTDTAVFRPSDTAGVADFYILNSDGFTVSGLEWGLTGDIPVVADYDGDGISDERFSVPPIIPGMSEIAATELL